MPRHSAVRDPIVKAMWLRGPAWCYEAVSALWKEVSTGTFTGNDGNTDTDTDGRNGGSVLVPCTLAPGDEITIPVVITWYFPNCYVTAGGVPPQDNASAPGGCCRKPEAAPPPWRPYYASQWKDARDVALCVHRNYRTLRARTLAFKDALFSSSLPPYVLDAVSANLAILKSPTVLRQENGNLWGWEGCFSTGGCCHGACTHVWNYAQSIPHLFPDVERTLREQELKRSMHEDGYVKFRAALPDGPAPRDFHAAADGQLGGIMKVYRDWHICGDREWLRRMYPLAKRSLDYCIRTWDPDHKGALFEPHHNTYDIEFWGPDGMCTSIYLGALCALVELSRAAGHPGDAPFYEELARQGAAFMDKRLFNGEYYLQKVMYTGLRDRSFLEKLANPKDINAAALALLKKEGPKYQYANGCLSDGVIGAWMAKLYGIETPLDRANVRKTLRSIFRYNFRRDLSDHANTQRPGYAMGREGGLILCTWPKGGKPTLPFIYSDETWTGIEYQVASHLILEGLVDEGLAIVRAARSRHDGRARNPWNEYECGSYYARAMASYALLGALSGFRYSAVNKTLWFAPKIKARPFRTFFCTASGYGTITLDKKALTIEMIEGELAVERVCIGDGERTVEKAWRASVQAGRTAKTQLRV
ncbi:MAG: GH116 family glycosyl hydrolase [Planctomycetota bacterium]|nr:GH116 family glycosyl hydrolase [Planctomycetota bacterium]